MRELKQTDGTCPLPPPSPRPLKARKPQVEILEGGLASHQLTEILLLNPS